MEQRYPSAKQVLKLVSSILPEKIKSVETIKPGVRGRVFQVSTAKKTYVLKTSSQNFALEKELLDMLRKKGVPVAGVIATDADISLAPFKFSLMEKIDGKSLNEISKDNWPVILNQVGSVLNSIHQTKAFRYGPVDFKKLREKQILSGFYSTWVDYLGYYVFGDLDAFKKKIDREKRDGFKDSKLNKRQIQKILKVINRSDKVESRTKKELGAFVFEPRLLYRDLHFDHIFVKENRVVGLIDFAEPTVGDPLFDIAYLSVMPNGEYYPNLLESWKGEFDNRRVHLYRLLISLEKLHTRYVEHNYLDKYPEIIDYALAEIQK